jgi:DNA repair exonuclease SbcCD ATPase subunit
MKNFDHINKSNFIIEEIIILNKRLIQLQNIYNRYKIVTTEIEMVKDTVMQNKIVIDNHLEKYGELLSKQEVCPFCLSHIDEEKVNHIIEHYK